MDGSTDGSAQQQTLPLEDLTRQWHAFLAAQRASSAVDGTSSTQNLIPVTPVQSNPNAPPFMPRPPVASSVASPVSGMERVAVCGVPREPVADGPHRQCAAQPDFSPFFNLHSLTTSNIKSSCASGGSENGRGKGARR